MPAPIAHDTLLRLGTLEFSTIKPRASASQGRATGGGGGGSGGLRVFHSAARRAMSVENLKRGDVRGGCERAEASVGKEGGESGGDGRKRHKGAGLWKFFRVSFGGQNGNAGARETGAREKRGHGVRIWRGFGRKERGEGTASVTIVDGAVLEARVEEQATWDLGGSSSKRRSRFRSKDSWETGAAESHQRFNTYDLHRSPTSETPGPNITDASIFRPPGHTKFASTVNTENRVSEAGRLSTSAPADSLMTENIDPQSSETLNSDTTEVRQQGRFTIIRQQSVNIAQKKRTFTLEMRNGSAHSISSHYQGPLYHMRTGSRDTLCSDFTKTTSSMPTTVREEESRGVRRGGAGSDGHSSAASSYLEMKNRRLRTTSAPSTPVFDLCDIRPPPDVVLAPPQSLLRGEGATAREGVKRHSRMRSVSSTVSAPSSPTAAAGDGDEWARRNGRVSVFVESLQNLFYGDEVEHWEYHDSDSDAGVGGGVAGGGGGGGGYDAGYTNIWNAHFTHPSRVLRPPTPKKTPATTPPHTRPSTSDSLDGSELSVSTVTSRSGRTFTLMREKSSGSLHAGDGGKARFVIEH